MDSSWVIGLVIMVTIVPVLCLVALIFSIRSMVVEKKISIFKILLILFLLFPILSAISIIISNNT